MEENGTEDETDTEHDEHHEAVAHVYNTQDIATYCIDVVVSYGYLHDIWRLHTGSSDM